MLPCMTFRDYWDHLCMNVFICVCVCVCVIHHGLEDHALYSCECVCVCV